MQVYFHPNHHSRIVVKQVLFSQPPSICVLTGPRNNICEIRCGPSFTISVEDEYIEKLLRKVVGMQQFSWIFLECRSKRRELHVGLQLCTMFNHDMANNSFGQICE